MKRFIVGLLERAVSFINGELVTYWHHAPVVSRIKEIKTDTNMLLSTGEALNIYNAVMSTAKLPGDIAEVGVYRGGSARLIAEHKGKKTLHLFDTFDDGLPAISENDSTKFYEGQFATPISQVSKYLARFENVALYEGRFPETADLIENRKFSFVHLDVDIYQSTKDALEFFYPRMVKGGIIISHDYRSSPGVTKAFHDFFADKPEPLVELFPGIQVLVVKT